DPARPARGPARRPHRGGGAPPRRVPAGRGPLGRGDRPRADAVRARPLPQGLGRPAPLRPRPERLALVRARVCGLDRGRRAPAGTPPGRPLTRGRETGFARTPRGRYTIVR